MQEPDLVRVSKKVNHFDWIATGNEFRFQYLYFSSKIFARSRSDVVPRTGQGLGTKESMITLFFTERKLIVLSVLPKDRKYDQLYFVRNIFPDLKKANMKYQRRKPGSAFWVQMDNSMYRNGSKIDSKFGKHGVSQCLTHHIRQI